MPSAARGSTRRSKGAGTGGDGDADASAGGAANSTAKRSTGGRIRSPFRFGTTPAQANPLTLLGRTVSRFEQESFRGALALAPARIGRRRRRERNRQHESHHPRPPTRRH